MRTAITMTALMLSGCGTLHTQMLLEPVLTCADWDEEREAATGEADAAAAALDALEIPALTWEGVALEAADFRDELSAVVRVRPVDGDWSFVVRDVPEGTRIQTQGPFREVALARDSSCPTGELATFVGEAEIGMTQGDETLAWTLPARVERALDGTTWIAVGGGWADEVPDGWAHHLDRMLMADAERTNAGLELSGRLGEGGSGNLFLSLSGRGEEVHYAATLLHGTWGAP